MTIMTGIFGQGHNKQIYRNQYKSKIQKKDVFFKLSLLLLFVFCIHISQFVNIKSPL